MKRPSINEQRFGEIMDRSFAPLLKESKSEASAAYDRVLQRLQDEKEAVFELPAVGLEAGRPSPGWFRPVFAFSVAAVAILVVMLQLSQRDRSDVSAIAASSNGTLSRAVGNTIENLRPGDRIDAGDLITAKTSAAITLDDASQVEMRAETQISLERVTDGVRINLGKGSLIVHAAPQRAGHLYVRTKDMAVSVVGTVFLVQVEEAGSRVAVIEGQVKVQQGGSTQNLLPGEQMATSPSMAPRLVEESLAWSGKASSLLVRMEESAMTIAVASAQAQGPMRPASTPKWEVVAIRPCGGDAPEPGARGGNGTTQGGGMATPPGGLLRVVCLPVKWLIERAYVKWVESDVLYRPWYFPITGGPSWIETDAYSIEAKAEGQPSEHELRGPMLQVILEERFNLKIRREVREEPVYELRVAESGFKLKSLKDGECDARHADVERERNENAGKTTPLEIVNGRPVINITTAESMQCGYAFYASRDGSRPPPGAGTFTLMGAPMSELIRYLDLDRIILDKTGIQGQFDIELTYGRYNSPMREPRVLPEGMVPGGDTVFAALEKQLGLTLVRARGPRIYYTIESISRPTPN
jgi:uncharacterized protein (TIGR03435 family)